MLPEVGHAETITKTWGYEFVITNSREYCGKILHFKSGGRGSLHYHLRKDETFYIQTGLVCIELQNVNRTETRILTLRAGDSLHIPAGVAHRVIAFRETDILEFSTQHFDDDVYRIEPSGE